MSRYHTYLCGGDNRPAPRETGCPDSLHDWPLPPGYVDASEEAARRLARRWNNRKCRACGFYGWLPSLDVKGTTAEHWQAQTIERPERVETS